MFKFSPGNIWSGSSQLAVLTNPTELAFRKGNLKHHYPVEYSGKTFADVEAAYKCLKGETKGDLALLMRNLMIIKFLFQYSVN